MWAWMYGTTDQDPNSLTGLAKSWVYPPKIKLKGQGFISHGYDRTQRNYDFTRSEIQAKLEFTLQANNESPTHNPAFYIKNWGDQSPGVTCNGKPLKPGRDYRVGHLPQLTGADIILCLNCQSTEALQISISSIDPDS